ncbi:S-layer homology domain-containing protein [Bacillus sp. 1P06AnD]|uniref:S-layer homology domain-containing protein n=1 Tax=Bacillus sp. 1P06AnD TaxID=3132208 RepID=UPI0039A30C58
MAYKAKSYRKFVATAATATLVASAVAPLASASSFTDVNTNYKEAVDFVVSKGANGLTEKEFGVYKNIKRGDAAVLLVNVLGLDVEKAPASGFKDVPARAVKEVNALKEAGITSGKTETSFGFDDEITRGELAIWIQKGFDLKAKDDKEIPFKDVNKNYTAAVKALVDNGVTNGTSETTFGTTDKAMRGDYAKFLFHADQAKNPVVTTPEVKEVGAINAKTLKVTFNGSIDEAKAKFEVKKGSVTVNVAKTTVSDDKKSVQLELASKLFEGEYTVNVTGLSEEKLSGSVKVENEKVDKVEILSENAPLVIVGNDKKKATVAYRVLNQYGEDITKAGLASSINWNASNGVIAEDDNKGVVTLTSTVDYKVGDKVVLTGINQTTSTVVTKTLTISDKATADKVEYQGVYHADGKELSGGVAIEEFALLMNITDQYGNVMKNADDLMLSSSNPSIIDVKNVVDKQGKDKNQLGLKFTEGENYSKGGKVIITAITKGTGHIAQVELDVKAAATVDTFSLSAPEEVVAANETVTLPFTAVDQFGNAVTKYSDLNGKVKFSNDKTKLEKDAKGNAVVKYTAGDKGIDVIIASVQSTGKVSTLQLDVKETAYAASIEPLKDVTTTLAIGGTSEIKLGNIVVKDQYGRTMKLDDKLAKTANETNVGKYSVGFETSKDGVVSLSESVINAKDGSVKVTGEKKGSEDVTVTLKKVVKNSEGKYAFEDVNTSALTVGFSVAEKASFESYEVGEVGTLYADGAEHTHAKTLKVYGVTKNGSKVLIPTKDYTVITDSKVDYTTDNKLDVSASANDLFGDKDEITSTVKVIVDGYETPVTVTKEVTISKVKPVATTIEVNDEMVTEGAANIAAGILDANNDAPALNTVLKIKDQYGVELTTTEDGVNAIKISATNLVDADTKNKQLKVENNGTSTIDIQGAEVNDTFNITYTVGNTNTTVKYTVVNSTDIAATAQKAENTSNFPNKDNLNAFLTQLGEEGVITFGENGKITVDTAKVTEEMKLFVTTNYGGTQVPVAVEFTGQTPKISNIVTIIDSKGKAVNDILNVDPNWNNEFITWVELDSTKVANGENKYIVNFKGEKTSEFTVEYTTSQEN